MMVSDSVIFKVRILVALLNKSLSEEIPKGFFIGW